jgi:Uma2 family endonuclease
MIAGQITSEDFFRLAPEDRKAELVDGILIVAPPPSDRHERLLGFLFHLLREYAERFDLGEVRGSRTAVLLDRYETYEPDLLFVARERLDILGERGVTGAPDLVVEILSASTAAYDRGTKLRNYDRSGVREIWMIDPYGPAGTEIYQRQEDGLRQLPLGASPADAVLPSLALPGLRLRLEWLWPLDKFIPVHRALSGLQPPR